ncbi:DNA cytosine methyltransferase [Paenibacillus sp. FSL R7-0312]|uniref:DNA cytosine methyltransferase n=1 Tax=Paenibacillus sp. FSL R7-0312 TaxID=2921682 RepID=UPI0030FA9855
MGLPENIIYKTAAFLFAGIGGATAGAMRSTVEFGGKVYKFKVLCSIDNDPVACRNHDLICGENTSVVMDLFKRWQYEAWHGHEAPDTWRETTPWDIWLAFKEQVPFFLFLSPPCKGLSGLLPSDRAASAQYQALNFLTVHGLEMALQACLEYGGSIPAVIQLENVPRITSRGKPLLKQILKMLKKYGYEVSVRSDHNLGTIGGLGQNRVRFLLKARDPKQIPNVIYYPEAKPMKSIGEVLGPLPAPGDTVAGGPMNKLQQLQWKTWMRLALILAGGDWRDLNKVDWQNLRIAHEPRRGAYEVADWNEPSRAVTSTAGPGRSNGVAAVSDPRLHINSEGKTNILRIQSVDEQSSCITGAAGPYQGGASIADPALKERPSRHPAAYRVVRVDEVAPCVTGTRFGSGAIAIADPLLKCTPRADSYGVQDWDQPAKTVIGSADIHASAAAVADPRIPKDNEQGVWVIIAQDGTWHRPLTTYELAMLQNFPTHLPDGRPFQLEGCNDAKAREYIGNAVPPGAEEAMGNVILMAAAEAEAGISFQLSWNPVWVAPGEEQRPTVLQ